MYVSILEFSKIFNFAMFQKPRKACARSEAKKYYIPPIIL